MKNIRIMWLVVLMILSSGTALSQPIDKVSEILRLTSVRTSAEQIAKVYLNKFKKDNPNVPAAKWASIEKSLNHDLFVNNVANIYRKNYSDTELTALLGLLQAGDHKKFYEQTKKTEAIMYDLGKEYGKSLSAFIFQSIK